MCDIIWFNSAVSNYLAIAIAMSCLSMITSAYQQLSYVRLLAYRLPSVYY